MAPILHSDDFRKCLQTGFELAAPGSSPVPLTLVDVHESFATPKMESFSLLVHGPLTPWFRQATYRLQHEKLGALDVFLVPLGPAGDSMQYEAVFNLLRDRP